MYDMVDYKTVVFERERVCEMMKHTKEFIAQLKATSNEDYIYDMLSTNMDAFLYTQTHEEQTITRYAGRPSFLDWILRRRKKYHWTVKMRDVLKNPPATNAPTVRMYEIGPKY